MLNMAGLDKIIKTGEDAIPAGLLEEDPKRPTWYDQEVTRREIE